jgi:hypothetical protein
MAQLLQVGKRKNTFLMGGSTGPTETVEHDEQTLLQDDYTHVEEETVKYGYKDPLHKPSENTTKCKCRVTCMYGMG